MPRSGKTGKSQGILLKGLEVFEKDKNTKLKLIQVAYWSGKVGKSGICPDFFYVEKMLEIFVRLHFSWENILVIGHYNFNNIS